MILRLMPPAGQGTFLKKARGTGDLSAIGVFHDSDSSNASNHLNRLPSPRGRHPQKLLIIKSFCRGSRGTVFSKRVPLAAGGKSSLIILLLVFLIRGVFAAEIIVAKSGGDYSSIRAALNAAAPGDTISVRAGVYSEKLTFPSGGNAAAGFITLRAFPGEYPVLDGQGVPGANMIYIQNKNYIKIIGLEIRNNLNVNDGSGVRVEGSGSHIEIRSCKIHSIRGSDAMGISVFGTGASPISNLVIDGNVIYDCDPAQSEALTLNGNVDGFTVSNNVVHDVNNIGIDFIGGESWTGNHGVARNGVCKGNTVYRARSSYGGGYAAGIYVDGGKDIVIEANRVYECDLGMEVGAENPGFIASGIVVRSNLVYNNDKAGIGFGGYDISVGRTKNCFFYNNVLFKNDTLRDGNGEFWIQYAENNVVKNNIVYCGPQNLMVASYTGNIDTSLDYNLWFADAGQAQAKFQRNGIQYNGWTAYLNGTHQDAHSLFTSPGFTDAAHHDFHLQITSPAIDAGDPAYTAGSTEADIDGQSRVINRRVDIGADEVGIPIVTSPNGGENWPVGSSHSITWSSLETGYPVKIQLSIDNGSTWSTVTQSTANDGAYSWTVPGTPSSLCLISIAYVLNENLSDSSDAVFSITGSTLPPDIQLSRTQLYFGAAFDNNGDIETGAQDFLISNKGGGVLTWAIDHSVSWLNAGPLSGAGTGTVTVSVNTSGLSEGTYAGNLTITASQAINSPQVVMVTLRVYGAGSTAPPFGSFDTPADGAAGLTGSIAVTGWVLDDIEVDSVKIFRLEGAAPVYIGDALLVEGARPDIELAFPNYPFNYKAGWGYMLLTNFLPNGGNGSFTLYAEARDKEGNSVALGTKTLQCDNAHAVKPFGAIDTPAPGGIASGSNFIIWGWVLTPAPHRIPTDGSTINIFVDGVMVGHPVYNIYRSDIAGLFPGYANSNGAAGYFSLDTTAYANGVHTIFWIAADEAGNTDGIGSRYFTIRN